MEAPEEFARPRKSRRLPLPIIPETNLILTGYMGVGKRAVGRAVAERMGVEYVDLESAIAEREGMPLEEVRQIYGAARARQMESELCREFALRHSIVIAATGTIMLDDANRERLRRSGVMICLTCALNEVLRRLHAAQGARFHDPSRRGVQISRLKREWDIQNAPGLSHIDTTNLSVEEVAEQAAALWEAQPERV